MGHCPPILTTREKKLFKRLNKPFLVQEYLDTLEYSADPIYRSPREVIRDAKGHCFDGVLFAAAAFWLNGIPPLVLEMVPNGHDDDHMIALYTYKKWWGAVAKSNFTGLRFREPIYRSLRELVISYFEDFYNSSGEKTLRGYTAPQDLRRFSDRHWVTSSDHLEEIADSFDRLRHYWVVERSQAGRLRSKDSLSLKAGMIGANPKGLFKLTGTA